MGPRCDWWTEGPCRHGHAGTAARPGAAADGSGGAFAASKRSGLARPPWPPIGNRSPPSTPSGLLTRLSLLGMQPALPAAGDNKGPPDHDEGCEPEDAAPDTSPQFVRQGEAVE